VNIYKPAPSLEPKGVFSAQIIPLHHNIGYM